MAAFMSIAEFKAEYQGALSDGETITATRMLDVVADRIRELKPDAPDNKGKQVSFEVVRDAANYGELEKLSSFQNVTSRRTEAGTFDEMAKAVDDLLTRRHRGLLGIITKPAYYFGD